MQNIVYESHHDKNKNLKFNYSKNANIRNHFHRSYELIYVTKGVVEVGVLFVQLGNVEHGGELSVSQSLPALFGTDNDAGLCGEADDAGVGNAEGLSDLSGEVEVAGVIQNVQLSAGVFYGNNRGLNGILSLLFFFVEVGNSGAVGTLAETGDCLGEEEHAFAQSGLTVATMAEQGDVADIIRSIHS